jgi:hypothetical protein
VREQLYSVRWEKKGLRVGSREMEDQARRNFFYGVTIKKGSFASAIQPQAE